MGLIPVLWAGGETSSLTRADQAILMVWDGFAPDGFDQGFVVLNTTGMSGVTGECFKKSHRFWRKPYRTPECEPYVGPNTTWRVAGVGKGLRPQLCVFLWVPRPTGGEGCQAAVVGARSRPSVERNVRQKLQTSAAKPGPTPPPWHALRDIRAPECVCPSQPGNMIVYQRQGADQRWRATVCTRCCRFGTQCWLEERRCRGVTEIII
jgi:hypothetical protein